MRFPVPVMTHAMGHPVRTSAAPARGDAARPRASWARALAAVLLLPLAVLVVRALYLWTVNPYGLVGDEAHYWEWSRRLALSYYTKGPGIAWSIRASTALFGDTVFAVKLPALVAGSVLLAAAAWLGHAMGPVPRPEGGPVRSAGLCAAVAVGLMPGYLGTALIASTDGPYAALWLVAVASVWAATRPDEAPDGGGGVRWAPWGAAGRRWRRGALQVHGAAAGARGGAVPGDAAPGTPAALGSTPGVGAGGARRLGGVQPGAGVEPAARLAHRRPPARPDRRSRRRRPDRLVVEPAGPAGVPRAQLGLLGGVGALLIVLAAVRARRSGRHDRRNRGRWDPATRLLLASSLPILAFYAALALVKPAQGNWALAGYAAPLVLVGRVAASEMPRHAARVRAWRALPRPRPRVGILAAKPESWFQIGWHAYLAVGLVAAAVLFGGPAFLRLPGVRAMPFAEKVADRVSGHAGPKGWISRVSADRLALASRAAAGGERGFASPLLISSHYQKASLLAFGLSDHPSVFSAVSALGGRPSPYDFFPDTDLTDPTLVGRPALLIGGSPKKWAAAFDVGEVFRLSEGDPTVFGTLRFGGPRVAASPGGGKGGTP